FFFFFSSRRRHTRLQGDWSSDVCSSDLTVLRDALLERRRQLPALKVLFITDPVNELYGAAPSADLRLLRAAGVDVVVTDLDRLRSEERRVGKEWTSGGTREHVGGTVERR